MTDETKELPLNQEQETAAEGFFDFLLSDEKEMRIDGPGGTGKTHLMGHMIDKIMPRYYDSCKLFGMDPLYDSVHMTATTNKAAEVLSNSANKPTQTVQSLFNLTVFDDYETGKSKLTKSRNWMVHERKIVFIDEGSMIDTPLDTCMDEGTIGCKRIYVGDECQLPPVMEPLSPIYRREMRSYKLTQPMRTQIPELHSLNWQLRTTVETGIFKPIQIIPGIIDWLDPDQMDAEVQANFISQENDNRILAYTNKMVQGMNGYIRDLRQLPDHFTVGEVLINNNALKMQKYVISVEEEVTITAIKPLTEAKYIDTYNGAPVYMDVWVVSISTKLGGEFHNVEIPANRAFFEDMLKWYRNEAKAQRQPWSKYYNLKNGYPDFRQRDASTVHKAQGSSLTTVYIDAGNLSTCHNPFLAARMLYVAASRARKRVAFYGQLAPKYGGFIF